MSNPFLQDNLIILFLKRAGVEPLKKLRKVDEKWLYLDDKELAKRSRKGLIKPVEFSRDSFQEDLKLFLKVIESNPELFRSFRLIFQDAFKFLESSFFANYRPIFLQLEVTERLHITQAAVQYLGDLLGWISKDIQELKLEILKLIKYDQEFVPVAFQTLLVFPNLRKFTFRHTYEFNPKHFIQHFNCILDRSREVDPTPKLTTLEIELNDGNNLERLFGSNPTTPTALLRWSTLTHLSLNSDYNLQRITSMLLSLASAGMSLENFGLNIEMQEPGLDLIAICSDLSRFFTTQAKSLKILKLEFNLGEEYDYLEPFGVISWPLFKKVHTLKVKYPFFDMGPIPVHFPSVQNLTFDTYFNPKTMFPDGIQPWSIHTLAIGYWQISSLEYKRNGLNSVDAWIDWLKGKFGSVVHLIVSTNLVKNIGQRGIPWSDTLQVLEIKHVNSPIKIGHLKALKKLVIDCFSGLERVEKTWFEEALVLNLESITFKCFYNCMPSDQLKGKFIRYFSCPVEFQEIKWSD